MVRATRLAGLVGMVLVLSVPAFAQTPATTPTTTPTTTRAGNAAPPAARAGFLGGTVQKAQSRWRSRTIVGATVRSDAGQRIATVRDLLLDDNGQIQMAVLSVSGVGGKFVAVPFTQLKFVPTQGGSIPPAPEIGLTLPPPQSAPTYGIVLPGATRDSLRAMEAFKFDS